MKKVLFGLISLVVIYLLLCIVGPKKLDVSVSKDISAMEGKIYDQIIDLKKWGGWSPWKEKDSSIKNRYFNGSVGKGAHSTWTSDKDGGGELDITGAVKNESVLLKLHFNDFDTDNRVSFNLKPIADDKTKVTWSMQGMEDFSFLSRGMMLFFNIDEEIKNDFKRGLELLNLKAQESKHVFPTNSGEYEVQLYGWEAKHLVGIRKTIKRSELKAFYQEAKDKVYPELAKNKIVPLGSPCGLIYSQNGDKIDMLFAFPVNKKPTNNLIGVELISYEDSKAYTVLHTENHIGLVQAHEAVENYTKDKGFSYSFPVIEQYMVHDFDDSRIDPKLLTRLYYLKK